MVSRVPPDEVLGRGRLRPTLFLFNEPTTGPHYHDVRGLIEVFQGVIETGHSVIEHNLELIKCTDWLIDLGPEAGEDGGGLVVAGSPETVAAGPGSPTGQALRPVGVGRQGSHAKSRLKAGAPPVR